MITPDAIEAAARAIDPVFRDTPAFESESISNACGARVVLKVETINPVRSFKGRGPDWLCHRLDRATGEALVCASAGNLGQGLAYAARKWRIPVTVFAATTANPLKVARMQALGADVRMVGTDFDAAKDAARAYAATSGARFIEDGRELALAEGAGTIALELTHRAEPLDAVLVPLGNGSLLAGIGAWLKAASPRTRVIGVCAAMAPAMERSWRAGRVIITDSATTMADGIAVRVPVPEALEWMRPVMDDIVLVPEAALVQAMKLLFHETGLVVEPSAAAGVAALLEPDHSWRNTRVATPLSGGNLTAEQIQRWLTS